MKDLFTIDNPPQQAVEILNRITKNGNEMSYSNLEQALKECEAIGYTFDYYLDAEPYGLRPVGTPLSEVEGYEDSEEDDKETEPYYITESGDEYTREQFVEIAKGNEKLADNIYGLCSWQHPETVFNELLQEGEIDENGNILNQTND